MGDADSIYWLSFTYVLDFHLSLRRKALNRSDSYLICSSLRGLPVSNVWQTAFAIIGAVGGLKEGEEADTEGNDSGLVPSGVAYDHQFGQDIIRQMIHEIRHREQPLAAGRASRHHDTGSTIGHCWWIKDKAGLTLAKMKTPMTRMENPAKLSHALILSLKPMDHAATHSNNAALSII